MENNQLHALMLVRVHNNIFDNINLAHVASQFVDREDRRKHSDIYPAIFCYNCKIKLTTRYFSYIYIFFSMKCIKRGAV